MTPVHSHIIECARAPKKSSRSSLLVLAVAAAALLSQIYLSFAFYNLHSAPSADGKDNFHGDGWKLPQETQTTRHTNDARSSNTSYFGACLMTKMDNDVLYEWLAYHRTILPLSHVVLGSDLNNTHDPSIVLERMEGLFSYSVVLNASDFVHRHGPYPPAAATTHKNESPKEAAHHALIHRQKGFITTCLEHLQARAVHWTLLVDSDEYLVFHTAASNRSTWGPDVTIPSLASNVTVLDVLQQQQDRSKDDSFGACLTVPRLLIGSLENASCPLTTTPTEHELPSSSQSDRTIDQRDNQDWLRSDFSHLDTLRFFQHAPPGEFKTSKFAKVLIDLSRMDPNLIATTIPRNIHRPYPTVCGKAIVETSTSPLLVHHYIGSWERYSARGLHDDRRNRAEWEQRAYVTTTGNAVAPITCQANMPAWVQRFVKLVGGREIAKQMLQVPARWNAEAK